LRTYEVGKRSEPIWVEQSITVYPLLYAPDRDEECEAIRKVGEGIPYLFSFTFGIPVDENYPIQE